MLTEASLNSAGKLHLAATPTIGVTVTPTPGATVVPTAQAGLLLWLTVGGVLVAGGVIWVSRKYISSKTDTQGTSIIRSWIAISLVIGLLIFCAATLLGSDGNLQSILFGGLVASTGAAIAFYFSSQGANDARADILNALTAISQNQAAPRNFSHITLEQGQVGQPYSYRITADGSPTPTYKATGKLPDGLTLDTDGTLHGTPSKTGTFTFTVIATNAAGSLSSLPLALTITPPPPPSGGPDPAIPDPAVPGAELCSARSPTRA